MRSKNAHVHFSHLLILHLPIQHAQTPLDPPPAPPFRFTSQTHNIWTDLKPKGHRSILEWLKSFESEGLHHPLIAYQARRAWKGQGGGREGGQWEVTGFSP